MSVWSEISVESHGSRSSGCSLSLIKRQEGPELLGTAATPPRTGPKAVVFSCLSLELPPRPRESPHDSLCTYLVVDDFHAGGVYDASSPKTTGHRETWLSQTIARPRHCRALQLPHRWTIEVLADSG